MSLILLYANILCWWRRVLSRRASKCSARSMSHSTIDINNTEFSSSTTSTILMQVQMSDVARLATPLPFEPLLWSFRVHLLWSYPPPVLHVPWMVVPMQSPNQLLCFFLIVHIGALSSPILSIPSSFCSIMFCPDDYLHSIRCPHFENRLSSCVRFSPGLSPCIAQCHSVVSLLSLYFCLVVLLEVVSSEASLELERWELRRMRGLVIPAVRKRAVESCGRQFQAEEPTYRQK